MKLDSNVICSEDWDVIQDPNRLINWGEKRLMSFITDKYKVIHIGGKNPNYKYILLFLPEDRFTEDMCNSNFT